MMGDDEQWRTTRRGAIGAMAVGSAFLTFETLGVTNMTGGRGLQIGLSDDDEAVLAVEGEGPDEDSSSLSAFEGETVELDDSEHFRVTVRDETADDEPIELEGSQISATAGDITIEVDDENSGDTETIGNDSESIDIGELITFEDDEAQLNITIEPDADEGDSLTVEFEFEAAFNGTTVQFTREGITIEAAADIES